MSTPSPPPDLPPSAKQFWLDMVEQLGLTSTHQFLILDVAASARDRIEVARRSIAENGLVIATEHSQKTNPAVSIENRATDVFLRAMKQLRPNRQESREERRKAKFKLLPFPKPGQFDPEPSEGK